MGAATLRALREEKWDYVVLQEMSNGPVVSKASFLKSASALCEKIRDAGAVPVLYATWAYQKDSGKMASMNMSYDEMYQAMYDAYHRIENISSDEEVELYDVVGPICESSDVFGKDVELNKAHRGDLIALRSAGAYGEVMASQYNCRQLPKAYYSDTI